MKRRYTNAQIDVELADMIRVLEQNASVTNGGWEATARRERARLLREVRAIVAASAGLNAGNQE